MRQVSPRPGTRVFGIVLALLALLAGFAAARAQEAFTISYAQPQGLDAGEIGAIAQDSHGFVWIGANGGLVRFDGARFTPWAPQVLDHLVARIAASHGGLILVGTYEGSVFRVDGADARPLPGPDGKPLDGIHSLLFAPDDTLWTVRAGAVLQWHGDGHWRSLSGGAFAGETPRRLCRLADRIGVITDRGVWAAESGGFHKIYAGAAAACARTGPAADWVITDKGFLLEIRGGRTAPRPLPPGRLISLITRDHRLWVAIDRYLAAYSEDGRRRVIGLTQGISSGGPMMVDREGGLWLGTFVGLQYFPQPDTLQWTQAEGLVSNHAFRVDTLGPSVWLSTWQGVARLPRDRDDGRIRTMHGIDTPVCILPGRGLLSSAAGHIFLAAEPHRHRLRLPRAAPDASVSDCAESADGTAWLATPNAVYRSAPNAARWTAVTGLPANFGYITHLWTDAGGLWVLSPDQVCRLAAGQATRCAPAPPTAELRSGIAVAPGRSWIASTVGLLQFDGATLRKVALSPRPAISNLSTITASSSGGYWISGAGTLARIVPVPGGPPAARVVEQPGVAQGLPGNEALYVREAGDELLIAGNRGLFRVPAAARLAPALPATVTIVAATIDGAPFALDHPLKLKAGEHQLVLSLSALSYKDTSHIRFRYRLKPDKTWSPPLAAPSLQFIDPSPGSHDVDIEASLDGVHWGGASRLAFSVQPPWWRTGWAYALYALAIAAIAFALHRLRLAHLLSLERQRARIAMDLHDEIGSNLGSIGLLAHEANRRRGDGAAVDTVIARIAHLAQLTTIGVRLMSRELKRDEVPVAELVRDLRTQFARMVPEGPPALRLDLPPAEAQREASIGADLYRHLQMVVVELTHNTQKHAGAAAITLAIALEEDRLVLDFADDGCGFDPLAVDGPGCGIENMRRRIADSRGEIVFTSRPGSGTRVRIVVPCRHRTAPVFRPRMAMR
jgi:signal transduction histidine kinase/ligand-binding sensor domain-containing protein